MFLEQRKRCSFQYRTPTSKHAHSASHHSRSFRLAATYLSRQFFFVKSVSSGIESSFVIGVSETKVRVTLHIFLTYTQRTNCTRTSRTLHPIGAIYGFCWCNVSTPCTGNGSTKWSWSDSACQEKRRAGICSKGTLTFSDVIRLNNRRGILPNM